MKPTLVQESDLDFDYGTFDSAGFTAQTLSSWQSLAAVIDHTLVKPSRHAQAGGDALRRGCALPLCLCRG